MHEVARHGPDFGAEPVAIALGAYSFDRQVIMTAVVVAQQRAVGRVRIRHEDIDIAVVVVIAQSGTVADALDEHPRAASVAHVGKGAIALIAE